MAFDEADIERAKQIARAKLDFTDVHSPGGQIRSRAVVYSRIVAGKLADAAVAAIIRGGLDQTDFPAEVIEYDAIRTDGYREPDEFDLQVRLGDITRDVEIRSSFSYRVWTPPRMLHAMSVYGWYTSGSKAVEPHREYYWQVLYHLRPEDIQFAADAKPPWPMLKTFEDAVRQRDVSAYVVGGATRTLLSDDARACVRRDQEGAEYRAIHPAATAFDVDEMVQALRVDLTG